MAPTSGRSCHPGSYAELGLASQFSVCGSVRLGEDALRIPQYPPRQDEGRSITTGAGELAGSSRKAYRARGPGAVQALPNEPGCRVPAVTRSRVSTRLPRR